jgi:hypothetical protein
MDVHEATAQMKVGQVQQRLSDAAQQAQALSPRFESSGALDHAQALADIHMSKPHVEVHVHTEHGITREWDGAGIDTVDNARKAAHRTRRQTTPPTISPSPPRRSR